MLLLPSYLHAAVTFPCCLNASDTKHCVHNREPWRPRPWRPRRCSGQQRLWRTQRLLLQETFLSARDDAFGPRLCCVCSRRLTVDSVCLLSAGMAAALRLPPVCRPQNVSAALCSSHAVRYRCHAAPLRAQCHRDAGQHHRRVSPSHLLCLNFDSSSYELEQKLSVFHRDFLSLIYL